MNYLNLMKYYDIYNVNSFFLDTLIDLKKEDIF